MRQNSGLINYLQKMLFMSAFLSMLFLSSAVSAGSLSNSGIFEYNQASYNEKLSEMYSEALDYQDPAVSSFALLRISSDNAGNYSIGQACDLWDYTNNEWIIINDPRGPEYISSSLGTIRSGLRGDCDDYSVFLSSLIMSIGGRCRIAAAQGTENNQGHSYPELFIGYDESEVMKACKYVASRYGCEKVYYSFTKDPDNSDITSYWMNLDWVIPKYYGPKYYSYGDTTAQSDIYHPGKIYYPSDSVTEYYAGGNYRGESLGYGYYLKNIFGQDTLNEL